MSEHLRREEIETFREMSLEEALRNVGNIVYEAAYFFERFEDAGKVVGNGHHMAQDLAVQAQAVLLGRWQNHDEVAQLSETHPAKEEMRRQSSRAF